MHKKMLKIYEELKAFGLSKEKESIILEELGKKGVHGVPERGIRGEPLGTLYNVNDMSMLQDMTCKMEQYSSRISTLDDLIERDKQREEDGFPRKIRIGRLVKPSQGGKDKVIVIPTTVEEKLIHNPNAEPPEEGEGGEAGGSGEGDEGDVIGEQPVHSPEGSGEGPGEGEGGEHEMESNAYDLGKILSEQFELPNLKDKGKKRSLTKYTYDLTDKNRGFGQVLDKKATLRKIVETNIALGRLNDPSNIKPDEFIIAPRDKVYRILSREKDYESQALVFFLRDYSGSMGGKPTELIVSQHVLIYSWLLYQYDKQVETRFILHDTEATEVKDFYTYYNSRVAGGTKVVSAYKLVNDIVAKESLEKDYNIYIFHGTDGDDWDKDGIAPIAELKTMLRYANRVGITIAERGYNTGRKSEVEKYLRESWLLNEKSDYLRLDIMPEGSDDSRIIEGIKKLIS
jgi:uncharacterized sporulation protein YeaH/YhbH (DUF444 family)